MSLTPAHRAAALPFRLVSQGLAAPTALKLGAAISFLEHFKQGSETNGGRGY